MKKLKIPDLEVKILTVLWNLKNRGSVQEIIDAWPERPIPGYTTILKKLQIMESKELVSHEKEGRAFTYIAAVSRDEISRSRINDMLKTLFQGNKLDMVGAFFADTDLSKDELLQIKKMIEEREENDD